MSKEYFVYIMTNQHNNVLYTGLTNDIKRRVFEHKTKHIKGFSQKYNVVKLVYFEVFRDIGQAIRREKQVKAGSRQKKLNLISSINEKWKDLSDDL